MLRFILELERASQGHRTEGCQPCAPPLNPIRRMSTSVFHTLNVNAQMFSISAVHPDAAGCGPAETRGPRLWNHRPNPGGSVRGALPAGGGTQPQYRMLGHFQESEGRGGRGEGAEAGGVPFVRRGECSCTPRAWCSAWSRTSCCRRSTRTCSCSTRKCKPRR